MKTTIDLPDDLARKAKAYASRKRTTLRAVMEQGIRQVLPDDRSVSTMAVRARVPVDRHASQDL